MKIAIFSDVFLEVPGGICSSIRAQREALIRAGHEVTIFCPGWHKTSEDGVVVVPTHPLFRPGGAPLSKRPRKVERFVKQRFLEFDFDLVHVHYEGSCSIVGMRLAREFGRPLVQTMHGREDMAAQTNLVHPFKYFVASVFNFLHARCIPHTVKIARDDYLAPTRTRAKMWTLMVNHANFADFVITPTRHFAEKLQKYGVIKPVEPISNGVSDKLVAEFDARGITPRTLKEGEALRIFWNSRVSREKRILPLIEAISKMKRPAVLTVCGDGNELKWAKKFARKLGVSEKIKFLGRVEHAKILEMMRGEHLAFVNSFGFDTQSLILLEAEATGLPVAFVDPDMTEVAPPSGSVNIPKELALMSGVDFTSGDSSELIKELWAWRKTPATAAEIAAVLDGLDASKIEQMSRAMYAARREVLQSTQFDKLFGLYKRIIAGAD